MTPPALPAGVRLTPAETYVLNQLSTVTPQTAQQLTGLTQATLAGALSHLLKLGQITQGGTTVATYLKVA